MNAAYLKGIIDYIEFRYPGIEFALPLDGDNLSLGLMTHIIKVHDPDAHICILIPSPVKPFEIKGLAESPRPIPRDVSLPKDFQWSTGQAISTLAIRISSNIATARFAPLTG
jgi:hypothetical protein